MKKLFNIFLLCLLAMTATAQSVQTHRLRIRLMPEKVLFFNLQCFDPTSQIRLSDYGYMIEGEEIVDLRSDTIDVDLQVPVGSIIIIKPFQYKGDDNAYKLVNWKASGGIVKLTEVKGNHLWRMPDYDVDLVGTFEYDPGVPDEGEQPGLGKWDAATGTLIIEGTQGREPVGFTYSDADKVLRYIRVSNSYAGETVYFSCGTFPNCTFLDASRTNAKSVNVSRSWAQERTALKEAVLPATIQTIGANAFEGTDLQTLVLYALTPPEMGMMVKNYDTNEMEWKTPFPDCTNMTVRVPADAVPLYQAAEHWKDYTILAIDGSYANLTVQLMAKADESLLEQYKNMSLVLTNKTSGQTRRYLMSGNNSYEFRYLTMNSLYKVQLLNDRNVEVAVADNIYLDKDKTVTFDRLRRIHQLSMTLTKEGKLVDQSLYSVTWLDEKGYYLKKSHTLSNMLDDEQLRCAVSIDRTLAMTYQRPDTMLVTVGAYGQPDDIKYALQLLKDTTVTVAVIDSLTRRGISDAVVQITQLLTNNESGQTVTLTTGIDGKATGKVLATLSRITVTSPIHGTQAFIINLADYTELTTEFQPANGTVIQLSHTWQAAVGEDETPTVSETYSDGRSLEYEFHALLPNGTDSLLSHYLASYPSYTLYSTLPAGSKVRVVATDTRGVVDDVTAEAPISENGSVQLKLPIVERGYIAAVYAKSESRKPGVLVFNAATGDLVKKQGFGNFLSTQIKNLPSGQYLVAAMSQGPQFATISSKAQLDLYVKGKDYVLDTVDVVNGYLAKAQFATVPLAVTQLETNLEESRSNWSEVSVPVAAYVTLGLKAVFKNLKERFLHENAEEDYPTDCKLEVYLSNIFDEPTVSRSYRTYSQWGSPHSINMKIVDAQWDKDQSKVTMNWPNPEEGGKVTISMSTKSAGTCTPEIYLSYTLKGKQYTEVIESSTLIVSRATINAPEVVINPTFKVTGTGQHFPKPKPVQHAASPNYQAPRKKSYDSLPIEDDDPFGEYMCVTIMDGDQPIGNTYVNEQGEWEATVTLHNATTLSRHNIYAKMDYPNGVKTQTESRVVTYDPNAVVPLTTKMSFFNHHPQHLVNTEVVFDYVNMTTYPISYGFDNRDGMNTDFTFEINLSNNDTTKVYACAVYINTEGPDAEERIVMAHYNARKNRWIAYDKFNTRSLPYNVMVEPYYYEEVVGSREYLDNYYALYDNLKKRNESINSLCTRIQDLIDQGNAAAEKGEPVPLEALRELNRQLSQLVGVEVNSGWDKPIRPYSELQAEHEQLVQELGGTNLYELAQKPFNELGQVMEGYEISKADGLTANELEATGYNKLKLDDGSVVYMLCDANGNCTYVDFDKNVKITLKGQSAARLSEPHRMVEMAQILEFDKELSGLNKTVGNIFSSFEKAISSIGNRISSEKEKVKELDKKIEDPESTWYETVKWELLKAGGCKVIEALEEVFVKLKEYQAGNVSGLLTSLYGSINDLREFSSNQKEMRAMGVPYCSHKELQQEAEELLREIADYSEEMLEKQYYYLKLDAEFLALSIIGLNTAVTGVGAIPGAVTVAATIIGIGVAVEHNLVYTYEYNHRCKYFKQRISQIAKQCKDYDDCKKRGDCPDCVKDGTCPDWPKPNKQPRYPKTKPTLDPSGFVYAGVESNRLEGVTTTVFYKETKQDVFGDDVEYVYMWDAENYGQVNPQTTDVNGEYGWMVPAGLWQVKYEKQGYQTEHSEWLPVPPPQLDVNQNMKQITPPQVQSVKATQQAVTINFDNYMKADSLTADRIFVTRSGEKVDGTIVPVMPADALEAVQRIVKKVRFVPATALTAGQKLTLTVKGSVESYADVPMGEDFQQAFDVVAAVDELRADSVVRVTYNQASAITIQALPAAAAVGKKATVKVLSDMVATADKQELTFDAQGRATLTLTGEAHGTTAAVLQMADDDDVKTTVVVEVKDNADFVCPMPTANYVPGQTYEIGTLIELTCEVPEAAIYYTLDGSCPCDEGSTSVKKYTEPIPLTGNMLIKAFAKAPGYADSDIAELKFMVDAIQTVKTVYKVPTVTYTLSGMKLTDGQKLPKGIYIRGNRKIVVK